MNHIVKLIVSSVLMCLLIGGSVCAFDIPEEPPIQTALRIMIVEGVLLAEFDLRGGTEWNYRTVRGELIDMQTGMYIGHHIKPTGYGYDRNDDGELTPDEFWLDWLADGINGNEKPLIDWMKEQEAARKLKEAKKKSMAVFEEMEKEGT